MDTGSLFRAARIGVIISAASAVGGALSLGLFFTLGGPFGTINDLASAVLVLALMPVALALHRVFAVTAPLVSWLATGVGLLGMLSAATMQMLLAFKRVTFEGTLAHVLTAMGAVGVWLFLTGILMRDSRVFPPRLGTFGIVAGVGYILTVFGFRLGGQSNPLFALGSVATLVSFPIWAIWLGRHLSSHAILAAAKRRA